MAKPRDSLEFLQSIYLDEEQPLYTRMDAAKAALKFERPALGVSVTVSGEEFAERLRAARLRLARGNGEPAELELIEFNPRQRVQ